MALPEDRATRLRCYRAALRQWNVHGAIRFKEGLRSEERLQKWLATELPGFTLRQIARELYEYVEGGGAIDEQPERRPDYAEYEFHYDLRVKIGGRRIYFETVLLCEDPDDPDDPVIEVVNVHDV